MGNFKTQKLSLVNLLPVVWTVIEMIKPPISSGRSARHFLRRMRASDMKPFLKTGCDMGWYGHFVGPVPTPRIKYVINMIMQDAKRYAGQSPDRH